MSHTGTFHWSIRKELLIRMKSLSDTQKETLGLVLKSSLVIYLAGDTAIAIRYNHWQVIDSSTLIFFLNGVRFFLL